jgi:sec-independent protein translocase protein TatB
VFDIGFLEMVVVGVLGLLILGPERLPKAAHSAIKFFTKLRQTTSKFQKDLEQAVHQKEFSEKLNDPYSTYMDEDESTLQSILDKPKKTNHDT